MCDEMSACRGREERHRFEADLAIWRKRALTAEAWLAGDGIAEGLREALRPFLRLDQPETANRPDSDPLYAIGDGDAITVGDVRRARAALTPADPETSDE